MTIITKDNLVKKDSKKISNSWIDIVFDNKKLRSIFPIARNCGEKDWQSVQLILSNKKGAISHDEIFESFKNIKNKVEIRARCKNSESECHVKSVVIEFRVLKLGETI